MARNETIAFEGSAALQVCERRGLVLIEGGLSQRRPSGPHAPSRRRTSCANDGSLSLRQYVALFAVGALVICLVCLACALKDAAAASSRAEVLSSQPEQTVVVQEGDSLWGIASEIDVEGVSTGSLVDWIESRNGIDGGLIVAGQTIVVPAAQR